MRTSSILGATLALVLAGALASCGSSTRTTAPTTTISPGTSPTTAGGRMTGSGPVNVLFAGSLVDLMNNDIGPAFHSTTGFTFAGVSGDSGSLVSEIKGKTQQGDVFISASPAKDALLEGAANGRWTSWYATFATSPLVLGYNPNSRFAARIESEPWYQVITQPGFLLGRTDPATDPKGELTAKALSSAATADNSPGLAAVGASTGNVFPEDTLVGRLQAGQLDAGFFYAVEAAAAKIPTVPLTGLTTRLEAVYTVTILANAPHPRAAEAFVQFLLGPTGAADLARDGLTAMAPPAVSGTPPPGLQAVLSGQ